jgi:D-tyrosyl-tRNA(Tyr) deacylase
MRALVQRVLQASVSIDGALHSSIGKGMLIFLGITHTDTEILADELAYRCAHLRIFEDADGKMNLSVKDISGQALIVSQFTLYAETKKGHRPSFVEAAAPEVAEKLYDRFVAALRGHLEESSVCTGVFRAMMEVGLVNDGPVTIMLERS